MTTHVWRFDSDGAWEDKHNWTKGEPASGDTVYLDPFADDPDGRYTVTLSSSVSLAKLVVQSESLVDAAAGILAATELDVFGGSVEVDGAADLTKLIMVGSSLVETAAGSLTASDVELVGGSIELGAANPGLTGFVEASSETVSIGDAQALGSADLYFDDKSLLRITNDMTLSLPDFGSTVAAATGVTLTLTNWDGILGDAADGGTIELAGSITAPLRIGGGAVVLGSGAPSAVSIESIASGATIDIAGRSTTLTGSFVNHGEITNSGALATLTIAVAEDNANGDYPDTGDGDITGQFTIGRAFGGGYGYTGNLILTGAGGISLVGGPSDDSGYAYLDVAGSVSVASTGAILVDNRMGRADDLSLYLRGNVRIDCPIDIEEGSNTLADLEIDGRGVITGAITSATSGGFGFNGFPDIHGDDRLELDGAVSNLISGGLGSGTLILTHSNCFAHFSAVGGTVQFATADAFGGGLASIAGTFECMSGGTLTNDIALGFGTAINPDYLAKGVPVSITLAVARGGDLILTGDLTRPHDTSRGSNITVGTETGTGTVTFAFASVFTGVAKLDVAHGTLRLGEDFLRGRLSFANAVVAKGATLDLAAHRIVLDGAEIDGSIVSSVAGGLAEFSAATVSGRISGAAAVEILAPSASGVSPLSIFLTDDTYKGDTTIDAGAFLQLGDGGTAGSIKSRHVIDNGELSFFRGDPVTAGYAISGSGLVEQGGAGTTTLTGQNSYSGGTFVEHGVLVAKDGGQLGTGGVTIDGGELSVAGAAAIGSGAIHLAGGELLERGTATIAGTLSLGGSADIAAAHGHMLTLASAVQIEASGVLTFGDSLNDGSILWDPASSRTDAGTLGCRVMTGVLELGDATAAALLTHAGSLEIDSGATLDLHGFSATLAAPSGSGAITDSGGAAVLTFADVNEQIDLSFAGRIGGALTLQVTEEETLTLSGRGSFATLELDGARDDVIDRASATILGSASESVQFDDDGITLALGASAHFTGHIVDFGDDAIDLQRVAFGGSTSLTYAASSHTLTVTDGAHSVGLVFDGTYSAADFALQDDGAGGTLVVNADTQAAWPSRAVFPHAAPTAFAQEGDLGLHHLTEARAGPASPCEHLAIA